MAIERKWILIGGGAGLVGLLLFLRSRSGTQETDTSMALLGSEFDQRMNEQWDFWQQWLKDQFEKKQGPVDPPAPTPDPVFPPADTGNYVPKPDPRGDDITLPLPPLPIPTLPPIRVYPPPTTPVPVLPPVYPPNPNDPWTPPPPGKDPVVPPPRI